MKLLSGRGKKKVRTAMQALTMAACLTLAAAAPAFAADSPYTAGINEDQTVTVGSTADLTVTVENSGFDTFNAVDMTLTYDPEMVELKTDSLSGMEFTDDAGTVRIIGYGDDKSCGDALTLSFGVKKAGTTEVTLSSAKVDESVSAINYDAPEAEIGSEKAVLTINYPVTLDDDLTGPETAEPEKDYTFQVKDPNYNHNIAATMDGQPAEVIDNGDGTYTVKNVTGALEITDETTPATFPVEITGDAADKVTAPEEATYKEDFPFSIKPEEGYEFKVKATVNGTEVPVNGPDKDGNYTIYGEKVTGPVSIEITRTEKKPDDGGQGSGGSGGSGSGGSGSGGSTPGGKTAPNTADVAEPYVWISLIAAAAAVLVIVKRKKA